MSHQFPDFADWDREARQFAENYARHVVDDYRRQADRQLATVTGVLTTPVAAIGTAFAIGSGHWWFAALSAIAVVFGCICLYQGSDHADQENDDT